jgi:DNA-binding transcriptional regulator/RsmH inhibitor MraZ
VTLLDDDCKGRFALPKEKAAKYQYILLEVVCIKNRNQELGVYGIGESDFIRRVMSNCSGSLI